MPCSTERIRLNDVGSGGDVLLMHLPHEIGRREIQFVIRAVDINALVIQASAHRTVEDVNVVRIEQLPEVFHRSIHQNQKVSPTARLLQKSLMCLTAV